MLPFRRQDGVEVGHAIVQPSLRLVSPEKSLYPVDDILSVYGQQRDPHHQRRLPANDRGEHLLPYRDGRLSGFFQQVILDPRGPDIIGQDGKVVGDGQEEHVSPHGERWQLPGHLLHRHRQAVEPGTGGAAVSGQAGLRRLDLLVEVADLFQYASAGVSLTVGLGQVIISRGKLLQAFLQGHDGIDGPRFRLYPLVQRAHATADRLAQAILPHR
ncbi:hypothetical protein AAH105_11040 [Parabacteroides distasonis]|uniref:hypothetical protein n=1 Tax=Parabacteroides distasonis TaxID=823 RepID=UPI0039B66A70